MTHPSETPHSLLNSTASISSLAIKNKWRFQVCTVALLIILIFLVLMGMVQTDRQWQKLLLIQNQLAEQARTISLLQQTGLPLSSATPSPSTSPSNNAFTRSRQATEQKDYAIGDWNVKSLPTALATLTPLINSDAYSTAVHNYVLESLLTRNPDTLEWVGLLAESWAVSADGQSVEFWLRPNTRFSDGTPLTADDVVFSYEFAMNESIAAPRHRAYYEKLKAVRKINARKVVFEFREPYFEILSIAGGMDILPQHFYAPYLKKPNEFNTSKGLLLGSGPYRLENPKSWRPDSGGVELVRNLNYWGDIKPAIDKIVWRVIQNDSARLTAYRNAEIDDYSARPVEYQRLRDDPHINNKSQQYEYMPPVVGYSYIAWNQKINGQNTRFADVRVRRALSALTDVERIIRDVFLGYAEPAISPFSPTSKQHNPELKYVRTQPELAQKLLAEAGYRMGNNKILHDHQNRPFEFKLTYLQSNDDTARMVLLLRDLYAEHGIRLIPDPQEWPVMLQKLKSAEFEAITLGWTSGIETNIYQMFHSTQIKTDGDNFINYQNSELDALIDQAQRTTQETERMNLWRRAEKILVTDQPYTFLMRRQSLVFIDQRIHNLQMSALGLNYSFVPMEIYVPQALQKFTR